MGKILQEKMSTVFVVGLHAIVDQELKKQYNTVLPMCSVCKEAGHTTVCQRPYSTR